MDKHDGQPSGLRHATEFNDLERSPEVKAIFNESGRHLRPDFIKDFRDIDKKMKLKSNIYAAAMVHFGKCDACWDQREHPDKYPQPQDLF